MNTETRYYQLADFFLKITFKDNSVNNSSLITSMEPFSVDESSVGKLLFELVIDDDLPVIEKSRRERIRDFEGGNGHTITDRIDNGNGYQFILCDIFGHQCCMLQSNKDFSKCYCALRGPFDWRKFGLTSAIMLTFAYSASFFDTVMIHSSLVRYKGYGYGFCAPSGTGKSTQVSFWLRYLPECDLMNDDNPIIRIIDGKPYIYGTPWSGKTPCYRNIKAPLGALTRINQEKFNKVETLHGAEAFTSTLPSCNNMRWDHDIFNNICNTVTKIVETTGIHILHCLPNKEAAFVCRDGIAVVK